MGTRAERGLDNHCARSPTHAAPNASRTVHGWKLGTTYAYAIDLLDTNRTVAWRLVYHDASAGADVQRQAAAVLAGMPAARQTAVIMTAANFDILPLYPDVLLAHLAPQHVILGHWDDFFRSSERSERVVRGIHAPDLVERLAPYVGDRWSAPRAGAVTISLVACAVALHTQPREHATWIALRHVAHTLEHGP